MVTIEYPCADGTLLPVVFADEAQAAKTWRLDHEHRAEPSTPLGRAMAKLGLRGVERAYDEVGMPRPAAFAEAPDAMGFPYVPPEPIAPADMGRMIEACQVLVARHGSALALWREYCMPRVVGAVDALDNAPIDEPLSELAEEAAYGLHMTMPPVFICYGDLGLLTAACVELYPETAELVAFELTRGFDNPTIAADQGLWELGRQALGHPAVVEALRTTDPRRSMRELRESGGVPDFFSALDAFLGEFGARAEGWDIACPTWSELGTGFWKQLEQMTDPAAPAPADALARAAQRREELAAEIRAALADTPEAAARFERRLQRSAPYVLVREERARWQVATTGALRHALLRRGQALVDGGLLDNDDDVLYLVPDEVEEPPGDARDLVTRRRLEHERWKRVTPPTQIGGDIVAAARASRLGDDRLVRGLGASRGRVVGRARVINDLVDADRLEPGDVLVCKMTAPPWTPLFGIAAAVVADSGTLSSHPAIAAREYGVPCIVGARGATTLIPDGATVSVDGEKGTVEVLEDVAL